MSNFHLSAHETRINGSILQAQCKKCDGSWNSTKIDLNSILGNHDGVLVWAQGGGFGHSCSNINISDDGSILTCKARRCDGNSIDAQINLAEHIGNDNGTLLAAFDGQEFRQKNQTEENSSACQARGGFTAVQNACQMEAVTLHNSLRARHGVSALTLDDSISKKAQAYAEYLANSGRFEHSSDRDGLGENLYAGSSSASQDKSDQGRKATQMWYDEIKDYDYNRPGFSMGTGHFTQVIWKSTNKLGMGIAFGNGGGRVVVVGRYGPAGNMMGDFPQNVPRPL